MHCLLKIVAQHRFPFIKLQLLKDNPCRIPNTHEWPVVVRQRSPLYPHDLIDSLSRLLNHQLPLDALLCDDGLGATCLTAPAEPPPLPSVVFLGVENGSVIAAETALGLRVCVNHVHRIAEMCPTGSAILVLDVVEVSGVQPMTFVHDIHPNATFYSFRLPLKPGNYTVIASIESGICPDAFSSGSSAWSVSIVSNERMRALQPHRVPMAVVDQITFNACTAPQDFAVCTGFTMHGDLGYVGTPRYALWSRHVKGDESVLFFYQHGINKAHLFPDSSLKVLLAMESRAAEPVMWQYIDRLQFDVPQPQFDFVLTHDRALLQREPPRIHI